MPKKIDSHILFFLHGMVTGATAILLLYSCVKGETSEFAEDDAIAASLGSFLLGILPELLRVYDEYSNARDNYKNNANKIREYIEEIRTSSLKIGTLLSLNSFLKDSWGELSLQGKVPVVLLSTMAQTAIDLVPTKIKKIKKSSLKWAIRAFIAAFNGFLSYIVTSDLLNYIEPNNMSEINRKLSQALTIMVPALTAIASFRTIQADIKSERDEQTKLCQIFTKFSTLMGYMVGNSIWMGYLTALITSQFLEKQTAEALPWQANASLLTLETALFMPIFEKLLNEHYSKYFIFERNNSIVMQDNRRNEKVKSLNFLAEMIKGAVISVLWPAPSSTVPTALLASMMGASTVSYFLPQIKLPKQLQSFQKIVSSLLGSAMDSALIVGFIKTLFDFASQSSNVGLYSGLITAVLFDMFILKPASLNSEKHKILKAARVIRNTVVTAGLASGFEQVLDESLQILFDVNLPISASVIGITVPAIAAAAADVFIVEKKVTPKILAATRASILLYGLLSFALYATNFMEEDKEFFATAFTLTTLITAMTMFFSVQGDAFNGDINSRVQDQEITSKLFDWLLDKLGIKFDEGEMMQLIN